MRKLLLLYVATLFLAACEKAEPYDFRHGQRPLVAEANYSGFEVKQKTTYTYDSMDRITETHREGNTYYFDHMLVKSTLSYYGDLIVMDQYSELTHGSDFATGETRMTIRLDQAGRMVAAFEDYSTGTTSYKASYDDKGRLTSFSQKSVYKDAGTPKYDCLETYTWSDSKHVTIETRSSSTGPITHNLVYSDIPNTTREMPRGLELQSYSFAMLGLLGETYRYAIQTCEISMANTSTFEYTYELNESRCITSVKIGNYGTTYTYK